MKRKQSGIRLHEGVPELDAEAALELVRKGRESWNTWVKENPRSDINFSGVDFIDFVENDLLDFSGFIFPEGNINFYKAKFPNCKICFSDADLSRASISFRESEFTGGDLIFEAVRFGSGNVVFLGAKFGKGDLIFAGTSFEECSLIFNSCSFESGHIIVRKCSFGDSEILFQNAVIDRLVTIESIHTPSLKNISFSGSCLNGSINLSNLRLNSVVDLTNTKLSHHLSLNNVEFNLKRKSHFLIFRKSTNSSDSRRFRRLKELAEISKDHDSSLELHAQEHRAARWHSFNTVDSILDTIYSAISNYGRSILRPLILLCFTWCSFGFMYFKLASFSNLEQVDLMALSGVSILSSLPFLTVSRDASSQFISSFFNDSQNIELFFIAIGVQGVISTLLLFLVGLALRNRFRL